MNFWDVLFAKISSANNKCMQFSAYAESSYVVGDYRYFDIPKGATKELYIRFSDKDTSVNVSDIYFGFNGENNGDTDAFIWNMTHGVVESHSNIANSGSVGTYCPYAFMYPSTQDALDRLLARYDICISVVR